MMRRMRRRGRCRLLPVSLTMLLLAACGGTTLDPAVADANALPRRELDAAEHERVGALVDAAMAAVVRRRFEEAGGLAAQAIELDPRCARARAVRAMVRLQRAAAVTPPELFEANAGEHELQLARQLAPDDAFVGWIAAVFLAETGHVSAAAEAAELALTRAAAAPPNERSALLGIAATYRYELGEERAALPHLREYVTLRPDDAAALFRLGSSLLRIAAVPSGTNGAEEALTRAAEAAVAFARCSELSPGDEDAALATATAHWHAAELARDAGKEADEQQHRRAAEQRLRAVAERFPGSAQPWFHLAVAAQQRGATDEARAGYRAALRRAPHVGAMLQLAAMLDASGDTAAADALLRQTLDASGGAGTGGELTAGQRRRIRERLALPPDQAPRML
jgi:tetratricopeptide (TPR) repeat protein